MTDLNIIEEFLVDYVTESGNKSDSEKEMCPVIAAVSDSNTRPSKSIQALDSGVGSLSMDCV